MREKVWQRSWFPGLALSLAVCLAAALGLFAPLERALYDVGGRLAGADQASRVAVVAIDDASLAELGDWPWPRDLLAKLVDKVGLAGPAAIGLAVPLHAPQNAAALASLNELVTYYEASSLVNEMYCDAPLPASGQDEVMALGARLRTVQYALDSDRHLRDSLKNIGNVFLGARASPGGGLGLPLEGFAQAAAGVGVLPETRADRDGVVRGLALGARHGDKLYPSLALQLATKALDVPLPDLERAFHGLSLGMSHLAVDQDLRLRPLFRPRATPVDSAAKVLSGEIGAGKYRKQTVLIGLTASSLVLPEATPIGPLPPLLVLAQGTAALLDGRVVAAPRWGAWLQAGLALLVALYLLRGLPRLTTYGASALGAGAGLLLPGVSLWLLARWTLWLPLTLPALLLFAGHGLRAGQLAWEGRRRDLRLGGVDIENNRMLGLALQGQGRLEMAFEKFRLCPVDDLIMSLLYNLALDFERKRQTKQALVVYRYMTEHDPLFRDIENRMARLSKAQALPQIGPRSASLAAWFDEESGEPFKPLLGRYQVEKKLGKGAMGTVYLGVDAKLDRMVALKTLSLSQEFEGEELQEATRRFFHEAAAAGRLAHPHIISVYDAGEEHDLAYISMEFFKGGDLVAYTRKGHLLPLGTLLEIMIKAAEALDYAHQQGVVHRDIKPANILYNPANGQIKLTDFGIARIIDTKKTKTGIILGTPSYMSPEQLAGKRVDGRSDLFSLGASLYQLLSGELPFKADSMASLMFKISSEPQSDILAFRPDLPLCLKRIVDTLLYKDAHKRYQSGAELAQALRDCLALMDTRILTATPRQAGPVAATETDKGA